MSEIIKFVDINVDGCGTNIEVLIQINGKPLTNGVVDRVKHAIENFKKEYEDEWNTDGCVEAAIEQLMSEGYKVKYLVPNVEIDF